MKKYRILMLVGSRRGQKSNTFQLCRIISGFLKENLEERTWNGKLEVEIITADLWNLGACLSCSRCFREGRCPQDSLDRGKQLKEKILLADCIAFASPVYAGTVSGDMKILIDRLSYWLHTMPLIGKSALVLSTADSNHGDGAISYMGEIIQKMGAIIICSRNVYMHTGEMHLENPQSMKPLLTEITEQVERDIKGEFLPTREQEQYFQMQLLRYKKYREFGKKYPELRIAEEKTWDGQGYFKAASMAEIVKEKRKHE